MKFCFRAALAALLCLTLTACGGGAPAASAETPAGGGMMVVNPMQAKTSLEEVNAAIGCGMKAPAGIAVSDEKFFVISGTIGEYRFTADGIAYTLRASATRDDISGMHVNGTTLGDAANAVTDGSADTAVFDSGRWTRWFDGEMQYSLVSDETGTQDTATLYAVRDALR
jgi:hypothetical protein